MIKYQSFLVAITFINFILAYKPPPEEELLAQILIRNLFQNERTSRKYLPYDTALVSNHAPLYIRLAFHMNIASNGLKPIKIG